MNNMKVYYHVCSFVFFLFNIQYKFMIANDRSLRPDPCF